MFVLTTPDEKLAKRCRDVFRSEGVRVKVVERNTSTIKSTLVKSNPFKQKCCQNPSCSLCGTGCRVNCKSREVVYKIMCTGDDERCKKAIYVGETSRSVAERFDEHSKMLTSNSEGTRAKSFLYDHVQTVHTGDLPSLDVRVLASCPGDPGMRQALEAVIIRKEDPPLNRKQEWTNEPRKRKRRAENQ